MIATPGKVRIALLCFRKALYFSHVSKSLQNSCYPLTRSITFPLRQFKRFKGPLHSAAERKYIVVKGKIMTKGTVKWFNPTKGFGFIQPEDGSKDAFVHISALERAGISSLSDGQRVTFELVSGRDGKMSAENLQLDD